MEKAEPVYLQLPFFTLITGFRDIKDCQHIKVFYTDSASISEKPPG
jgi:hypothetical protein